MSSIARKTLLAVAILLPCGPSMRAADGPRRIEPEVVPLGRPVDFARDVAPILESNCLACHNAGVQEGGLSLEDVVGMTKGGDRGPAVKPGQPDESLLLTVVAHRAEPVMPPVDNDVEAKNLTPRELGLIRQWILEGANRGGGTPGPMISWRPLPNDYRAIHAAALDAEARFAAVGRGNRLELYDLFLGGLDARLADPHLASLTGDAGPLYLGGAADRDLVQAVAFSPESDLLASAGYRAVKLWRRIKAGESKSLSLAGVSAAAISGDRTRIAAAVGREVQILNAADAARITSRSLPAAAAIVCFSPDGRSVYAACADGILRRCPVESGEPEIVVTLPSPATALVVFGDRVASAHDDGTIHVYSVAGAPERELKAHSGQVTGLSVLPQRADAAVSCGTDGFVRIWDVPSGREVSSLAHGGSVTGIAVSPDGRVIASCGTDGAVRFWNAADGNKLGEFVGLVERRRAVRVALSEAEWRKQLAAVAKARVDEVDVALKDREASAAKAMEARAGVERALTEARKAQEEAAATALSASEQAAAAPDDASLKMKSEEAAKASAAAVQRVTEAEEMFRSAERSLTLADEAIAAIKARLEELRREKQSSEEKAEAASAFAEAAKADADHRVEVKTVAFAPDSRRVVATYGDGTVQTFSSNGRPLDSWDAGDSAPAEAMFLSPNEAVQRSADGALHRVDVAGRWEYVASLGPPEDAPLDLAQSTFDDRVLSVAFSPDGRRLATGGGEPSRSGELILWEVATRKPTREFVDAHSDTVQSVEFSRDGRTLVSAAADKFAKAFDVETGSHVRSFEGHTDHVLGVSLKADGATVATSSADTSVKIWDATTGEQRKTAAGHAKQVTAVRYLGLSDRFATASGDRTVRLYRTNDGGQLRAFDGPADYLHALAASGDGATIGAAGEEGVLFVWDAESGKLLHRLAPPESAATASR